MFFLFLKKKFSIIKNITNFFFLLSFATKTQVQKIKLTNCIINIKQIFYFFLKDNNDVQLNSRFIDYKKKTHLNLNNFKNNSKLIFFKKKKFNSNFFKHLKKSRNLSVLRLKDNTELSIKNTLIKIKVFLNFSDFFFFLKKKFIMLNRQIFFNGNKKIMQGDLIELAFFKFYIIYLLKISLIVLKFKNINSFKKKTAFKFKKLHYNYFLKKLKVDFFQKNSSFNLFEIDTKSNSIFVIKTHINFINVSMKFKKFFNIFNAKFLGWKI